MAGDALSFADVLRDEYLCLHGHVPPDRPASVEPKHLREVLHLERTVMTSTAPRFELLKEAWLQVEDAKSPEDHAARAFNVLLGDPELFTKLLKDDDVKKAIRKPTTLRRLLCVRKMRRIVFTDPVAAELAIKDEGLFAIFLAESSMIRRLAAMKGGKEMFARYPALAATIADDCALSAALRNRKEGQQRREALIAAFTPVPPGRWWPFGKSAPTDETLSQEAFDARKIAARAGFTLRAVPRQSSAGRSALNALLLEIAFPDCFTDSYDIRATNAAFHEKDLAALCLSGGGIRSATFNLGILQGLADHRLLTKFHYISTVSGGGYIGSWLSSWIRRHNEGLAGVAEDLSAAPADPEEPEVKPIQHLREYSSYLAPRAAAFSTDTWTLVATYLRNLLLNWTMLIPAMIALLALPRLVESGVVAHWRSGDLAMWAFWGAGLLGAVAIIAVSTLRPIDKKRFGHAFQDTDIRKHRKLNFFWLLPMFVSSILFPILWASDRHRDFPRYALAIAMAIGTAMAGALYVYRRIKDAGTLTKRIAGLGLADIAATGAAGAMAGFLIETLFAWLFPAAALGAPGTLSFELFVCFAPALFLFIIFLETTLLVGLTTMITSDDAREWWARSSAWTLIAAVVHLLVTGAVLLLPLAIGQAPSIIASLGGVSAVVAWILARAEMLKPRGEEEGRGSKALGLVLKGAAAVTLVLIVGALALLTSVILAPPETAGLSFPGTLFGGALLPLTKTHLAALRLVSATGVLVLIVGAAAAALLMSLFLNVNVYSMHSMYRSRLIRAYLGASRWFRRPDGFTGFDPQDNVAMYELRPHALWPTDFVYLHGVAVKLNGKPWFKRLRPDIRNRVTEYAKTTPPPPPPPELASELAKDINKLMARHDLVYDVPAPRSFTLFARNRRYLDRELETLLRRMGTREEPHDKQSDDDDPWAKERPKQKDVTFGAAGAKLAVKTPRRRRPPLHIVNTTLNLVGGDNLAWQERKADSFTISPLHSGNRRRGYRDSFDYGERISLGTAMAISGAAVSPNMGNNSSPVVTFLMTLFNARLGWWLGNPAGKSYHKPGPTMALNSLVHEALGNTNDTSEYVFLSDGGHFDNLGIYEMVRRRCRYIVACDATADGRYAFADLGNAVRKIRVDTGIPITLSTTYLPPTPDQKFGRYCALGLIHYGDVDCDLQHHPHDDHRFGYLLYVKPAAYAECPPDVRNYKNENGAFPHESTIDQFFGESQFESYRALGRHIVGQMCGDRLDCPPNTAPSVAAFIGWSKNYIDRHTSPKPKQIRNLVQWVEKSLKA